ncbi:MAG: 5'/3'-nucleotidase SurE [Proteobacteria bacterium]|nr:5'/3'-nucleotidase SurE [Pseudomonadota bacterium]MBU1450592.1 5'/3'-nucleotidase SurE [Pseudomonadota bacterium]MBU2469171.1 5'/3'-nucleotidase SurE [Pseudomonadota bacterium]MBU2516897.1 5'/3'-nucleotidase SurE [Pseudomonadota bacterium]
MRLLLTNDDGAYAPGLKALHQALATEHEVWVVAPETEQSAVGHAITLADPIRVHPLTSESGMQGWAVTGTPADCVKLAVRQLLPQPVQMVISGINQGANVGVNLLYSGTVSAATEGAILGLGAISVSLATHHPADFSLAARVTARLVAAWPGLSVPPGVSLNVNVPALAPGQVKGVRFTRQSTASMRETFLERRDPRGHVYYWQAGEEMSTEGDGHTDYPALLEGYVTITPVGHDLTHDAALASLGRQNPDLGL